MPGRPQLGVQAQAGRADEPGHGRLVASEPARDLGVGATLQIAQRQHRALLRREPLVGGRDLALRRAAGPERLAIALEGQGPRSGKQVRGHVERLEPIVRQVRESARERQLDERRRGLRVARQAVAEAIERPS